MSKEKLTLSSHVLQSVFENGSSTLSQQFIRWKLWRRWADYVGPQISKVTEPVGFRQGTLFIFVINSTWMHQLFFGVDMVRDQINKKLGFDYVKAIHLTLNRRALPESQEERDAMKSNLETLFKDID
jgi:hypothetical protein